MAAAVMNVPLILRSVRSANLLTVERSDGSGRLRDATARNAEEHGPRQQSVTTRLIFITM